MASAFKLFSAASVSGAKLIGAELMGDIAEDVFRAMSVSNLAGSADSGLDMRYIGRLGSYSSSFGSGSGSEASLPGVLIPFVPF